MATAPILSADRDRILIDLLSAWIHRAVEDGEGEPRPAATEQRAPTVPVAHPRSVGVEHAAAGIGPASARAASPRSAAPSPHEKTPTDSGSAFPAPVEPAPYEPVDPALRPAGPPIDPFDPEIFNRRYLRPTP